jgi:hypothetical protein
VVSITDRSILPAVLLGFAGTYGIALAFHFGTLPNAENPAGGFAITLSNLAPFFLWLVFVVWGIPIATRAGTTFTIDSQRDTLDITTAGFFGARTETISLARILKAEVEVTEGDADYGSDRTVVITLTDGTAQTVLRAARDEVIDRLELEINRAIADRRERTADG